MYNFRKNIICLNEIDSTQKEIWRQFNCNKINDSCVLIAKKQTAGIGTNGRKWINESDENIIFSIGINLENKDITISNIKDITIRLAKFLKEIFEQSYNIKEIKIKHPNDLILNDRKIGGILTETKLRGNLVKRLVIGIGINTNQKEFKIEEIKNIATSIYKELNFKVDNKLIIKLFLEKLEDFFNKEME